MSGDDAHSDDTDSIARRSDDEIRRDVYEEMRADRREWRRWERRRMRERLAAFGQYSLKFGIAVGFGISGGIALSQGGEKFQTAIHGILPAFDYLAFAFGLVATALFYMIPFLLTSTNGTKVKGKCTDPGYKSVLDRD